jgi:hypothetical protein
MKKRSMISGILASVVATCLASCVITPIIPLENEFQDSAAKRFAPKPDVATIYVYRDGPAGIAHIFDVKVDGKSIGLLDGMTYLYTDVPPGRHTVSIRPPPDTAPVGRQVYNALENVDDIQIDVVAGRLHFVSVDIKSDQASSVVVWGRLRQTGEDDGKKAVRSGSLAKRR